jgi:hypothetical protein
VYTTTLLTIYQTAIPKTLNYTPQTAVAPTHCTPFKSILQLRYAPRDNSDKPTVCTSSAITDISAAYCQICTRVTNQYQPYCSRNCSVGIATKYGLEAPGIESQQQQEICLISKKFRPALGPTHPPAQCVPGFFPAGL